MNITPEHAEKRSKQHIIELDDILIGNGFQKCFDVDSLCNKLKETMDKYSNTNSKPVVTLVGGRNMLGMPVVKTFIYPIIESTGIHAEGITIIENKRGPSYKSMHTCAADVARSYHIEICDDVIKLSDYVKKHKILAFDTSNPVIRPGDVVKLTLTDNNVSFHNVIAIVNRYTFGHILFVVVDPSRTKTYDNGASIEDACMSLIVYSDSLQNNNLSEFRLERILD